MKRWADMTSQERGKAATEGRESGLSAQLIADKYGTTRNAIIGKWNRMKMRDGRLPSAVKKRRQKAGRRSFFCAVDTRDFNLAEDEERQVPAVPEAKPGPRGKKEEPMPFVPLSVPFLDRERNQCAWPLWEDGDEHRNCCGNPVDPEHSQPYCTFHAEISRNKYSAMRNMEAA